MSLTIAWTVGVTVAVACIAVSRVLDARRAVADRSEDTACAPFLLPATLWGPRDRDSGLLAPFHHFCVNRATASCC